MKDSDIKKKDERNGKSLLRLLYPVVKLTNFLIAQIRTEKLIKSIITNNADLAELLRAKVTKSASLRIKNVELSRHSLDKILSVVSCVIHMKL